MAVSLYTSRIVLQTLGVTDFGIYNVVGGTVTMLGFFSSSMATSTQRFLNVGMATRDHVGLRQVFSTAINAQAIIGLITVVLLETVGLWFVYNKLVIPESQMSDAIWVYQCSVLTFFISMISIPYNAAIIAHEKMSAFAYMSIIEIFAKLAIAYALLMTNSNRLRLYAIMLLTLSVIMRGLYNSYCTRNFKECKYTWIWDKRLIKDMFSFSGWMIFGCFTDLLNSQGVNILINMFFGPVFNASRGIASQVQSAIAQFSANFIMSVNPQITKSFAAKEYDSCYRLVYLASKMSFFLMMFMIIPVLLHSYNILSIWLGEVPPLANIFVNLILINYLLRSAYSPIAQINQAYGKVRLYQLSISSLYIINFVGSYCLFKIGFPVYSTFILSIIISAIGLFSRLLVLKKEVGFSIAEYSKKVILPVSIVFAATIIVLWPMSNLTSNNLINIIITCVLSVVFSAIFGYIWGLNSSERNSVKRIFIAKIPLLKNYIK